MFRRISACLVLALAATLWMHCQSGAANGSVQRWDADEPANTIASQADGTQTNTVQDRSKQTQEPKPAVQKAAKPTSETAREPRAKVEFNDNAFPPIIPDTEWHKRAWLESNCLRCHETGVGEAPMVIHKDLPEILLSAKCRSCHVLIPGAVPRKKTDKDEPRLFNADAFPPMIPNSESHNRAWTKDDCLLCHDSGIHDAPIVKHEGLPPILLTAKCRSCHVQVRAVEEGPPTE